MLPRAILFDLDDTLLDRAASIRKYCALLHEDFRDALRASALERIHAAVIEADDFGSLQQAEKLALSAIWSAAPSPCVLAEHWAQRFGEASVAFSGTIELLQTLSQRGIKTGVVTNGGAEMQRRKIAALRLEPLLGAIVISSEVGLRKPDRAIFRLALERLDSVPEHAWFVGDHPDVDVRGAEAAGLKAFWVKTGAFQADEATGAHLDCVTDLLAHL